MGGKSVVRRSPSVGSGGRCCLFGGENWPFLIHFSFHASIHVAEGGVSNVGGGFKGGGRQRGVGRQQRVTLSPSKPRSEPLSRLLDPSYTPPIGDGRAFMHPLIPSKSHREAFLHAVPVSNQGSHTSNLQANREMNLKLNREGGLGSGFWSDPLAAPMTTQ